MNIGCFRCNGPVTDHAVFCEACLVQAESERHDQRCRCGGDVEPEPHPCPFQWDVNNNDDPEYCRCCPDCTHECAMDV